MEIEKAAALWSPLSSRGTCALRRMVTVAVPPQPLLSQTARAHTGEADGLPDVMGGDSSSHFSVPITSSIWAVRGNEHCCSAESRFRLTEPVPGPVGPRARGPLLPPPTDRTPTTAARKCCACGSAEHRRARVCVRLL